jgi:anaerobic ribonucleoside-triphosphate reductase activating protein
LNILATDFTLEHRSLDIYVAGCRGSPHCEQCHNPESWDFNGGIRYDASYFKKIRSKVLNFNSLITNIMIFGGEINDSPENEVFSFLSDLRTLNKPIWLFTRFEIDQIPKFELELCDYVKTGRYIPSLACADNVQFGISLASSNQKIFRKNVSILLT